MRARRVVCVWLQEAKEPLCVHAPTLGRVTARVLLSPTRDSNSLRAAPSPLSLCVRMCAWCVCVYVRASGAAAPAGGRAAAVERGKGMALQQQIGSITGAGDQRNNENTGRGRAAGGRKRQPRPWPCPCALVAAAQLPEAANARSDLVFWRPGRRLSMYLQGRGVCCAEWRRNFDQKGSPRRQGDKAF